MKTLHRFAHRAFLLALAALGILTLAACNTMKKIPPRPDPAPILAAEHAKDATVTARADTIAQANASIAKTAPAVAPQTAKIAAAVADIKAAVAAAPAAKVDALVATQSDAIDARDKVVASQGKKIDALEKDSGLVHWLYAGSVFCVLAAVACGFFAGWVSSWPFIGAWLGKVIGPWFSGLLGAFGVTLYLFGRFIIWTHAHPVLFGLGFSTLAAALGVAFVNRYDHALIVSLESKVKAFVTGVFYPKPKTPDPLPASH